MPDRQAMVLVADEIFFNLHGKAILQGIYNSDLVINLPEIKAPQMVFYFMIETDLSQPFQSLSVQVTFPGSEPIQQGLFVPPPQLLAAQAQQDPKRLRWYTRHPMLVQAPTLRPGQIDAKVIHESGEIKVFTPWIVHPIASAPAKPN
jgi:hypothetical protein